MKGYFFQFSHRTEDSIICIPPVVRHSNIYLAAAAARDTRIICCSGRETELKKPEHVGPLFPFHNNYAAC